MSTPSLDRRIQVVLVAGALGIGGTEKGLLNHALAFDRARVDVRVVALDAGGPRQAQLEAAGVPVTIAGRRRESGVADLLRGADVVHVFRSGLTEPRLPAAARRAGVPCLVETNVFGAIDASADRDRFACHLFVSQMCAWRYRRRLGLAGPSFHERHRVLHWPIDLAGMRAVAPDSREAKRRLGLDPDRPVVGRIGRPVDTKWRNLIVDMIPELLRLRPDTQILLVGVSPAKRRRLRRAGLLGAVHVIEATDDDEQLATLYSACDVFVTASEIGESWSVAISEAMGLGRPVVTCSTPWADNGQIEQVDEGFTGHIVDHPRAFAQACAVLIDDPQRARQMGSASAAKADRIMDARSVTRQLESLYASLLADDRAPAAWLPSPSELDDFGDEYQRRLQRSFRSLTARERGEAVLWRRVERLQWALRALRHTNPRTTWAWVRARMRTR